MKGNTLYPDNKELKYKDRVFGRKFVTLYFTGRKPTDLNQSVPLTTISFSQEGIKGPRG